MFNLTLPDDLVVFDLFLYNKDQVYIPNTSNVYGSDYITIEKPEAEDGKHYSQYWSYPLNRVHWKAVDQDYQRCDDKQTIGATSKCLAGFLEGRIGCSMHLQGTNPQFEV